MNIKVIIFILAVFICHSLTAQIGGISTTKINTIDVAPIPFQTIEFEPTFGSCRSSSFWDTQGNRIRVDSTTVSSNLSWRVTYGLSEKTEVGLTTTSNINGLSIGRVRNIV